MLLIIFILAGVLPAIWPVEGPLAVHHIRPPSALIGSLIAPLEEALALEFAVFDATLVRRVILPLKEPLPVLLSVPEIPGIL